MRALVFWLIGSLLFSVPAGACSVKEDHKIPTNFELVQKAEVIVLARVKEVPPSSKAGDPNGAQPGLVTLEPIRFLKGSAPSEDLGLIGWEAPKNWSGLSTPTTLAQSHFSAGLGACIRQFYAPGELVVAMFENDPKMAEYTGRKLNQIASPWARAVETVDAPDDVWVNAVEMFLSLQKGPGGELNNRIQAKLDELSKQETPQAEAISSELQYFLTRTEPKGIWTSVALPTGTIAGVHGQPGIGLQCLEGTGPTVVIDGSSGDVKIEAGDASFNTTRAQPTPVEAAMLNVQPLTAKPDEKPPERSLYRISEPAKLLQAFRTYGGKVKIQKNGSVVAEGAPLDALLRWSTLCQKLQAMPAPATAPDAATG